MIRELILRAIVITTLAGCTTEPEKKISPEGEWRGSIEVDGTSYSIRVYYAPHEYSHEISASGKVIAYQRGFWAYGKGGLLLTPTACQSGIPLQNENCPLEELEDISGIAPNTWTQSGFFGEQPYTITLVRHQE